MKFNWNTGLVSLFNGISTFKAILVEEQQLYHLIHSWRDKGFHTFPKSLKVNIIVQLEFELTYFETVIQHFSHYTTGTIPLNHWYPSSSERVNN